MELSCFSFFHVTVIKSVLAARGAYPQRNFEIQERNGCLPDSTAYDTVMGSKRLTKSSLAQIRNPDLVINLKKEKRNNNDFDIQAVVINDYSLGNVTPPSRLPGRMERPVISIVLRSSYQSVKSKLFRDTTLTNIKIVTVFIHNLGNIQGKVHLI